MIGRREYLGIPVPALPEALIPPGQPDTERLPRSGDYAGLRLKSDLQRLIASLTQTTPDKILLADPPKDVAADFGFACHPLAKSLRKSPVEIAISLAGQITSDKQQALVTGVFAQKGFLNFSIDMTHFGQEVLREAESRQDYYGQQNIGNGAGVVIDCSSPNVAKYMSVGHLRSTIIGESLARIYKATGYTVIRDNHLGDWGTQFGMLARAYELWGQDYPELKEDANPVQGLYKLYVRIHEEVAKEKELTSTGSGIPADAIETSLEKEGKVWFQRLESGDEQAHNLLKWATKHSLKEFQRVYDLLGTKYEYMLGESFYISMLPAVLRFLRERGIASDDAQGAMAVDLQQQKLNKLVVQKSDGTSLYATRDLATLVARTAWFDPQKILYVVGADQKEYFQQVFATFDMMAQSEKRPVTEHIPFGMITLPEGKMSTRAGRVIFLEDVLTEAVSRAKAKTADDENARKIGVGAVVFSDLGQGRERNIKFDWDQALSFDGYSAPYIQYAHARASALIRRASEHQITITPDIPSSFNHPAETALARSLSRLPEAIAASQAANRPDILAQYIYDCANKFSELYQQVHILGEPDISLRNTRLRLAQATAQVIKNGLNLLCIEVPERM